MKNTPIFPACRAKRTLLFTDQILSSSTLKFAKQTKICKVWLKERDNRDIQ